MTCLPFACSWDLWYYPCTHRHFYEKKQDGRREPLLLDLAGSQSLPDHGLEVLP